MGKRLLLEKSASLSLWKCVEYSRENKFFLSKWRNHTESRLMHVAAFQSGKHDLGAGHGNRQAKERQKNADKELGLVPWKGSG